MAVKTETHRHTHLHTLRNQWELMPRALLFMCQLWLAKQKQASTKATPATRTTLPEEESFPRIPSTHFHTVPMVWGLLCTH